jgi:hypothetical protein
MLTAWQSRGRRVHDGDPAPGAECRAGTEAKARHAAPAEPRQASFVRFAGSLGVLPGKATSSVATAVTSGRWGNATLPPELSATRQKTRKSFDVRVRTPSRGLPRGPLANVAQPNSDNDTVVGPVCGVTTEELLMLRPGHSHRLVRGVGRPFAKTAATTATMTPMRATRAAAPEMKSEVEAPCCTTPARSRCRRHRCASRPVRAFAIRLQSGDS